MGGTVDAEDAFSPASAHAYGIHSARLADNRKLPVVQGGQNYADVLGFRYHRPHAIILKYSQQEAE
jgi:hypothetical protein